MITLKLLQASHVIASEPDVRESLLCHERDKMI